jgi:HAMP domain-containing protein
MSIQLKKSPARVLTQIINLIESIDLNKIPDNEKEEVSILAKQINKLTYNINRQL